MQAGVRGADVDDSDLWAEGGPDGKTQRLRPLYEVLELMRGPVFPMAHQLCTVLAADCAPQVFKIVPGHYAEQVTEATEWEGVSNVGPHFWHNYKGKAQKTSYTVHLPPSHGQVRLGIDQHDNAPSRPATKDVLRGREGVLGAFSRWIADRQKDRRGELVAAMKDHPVFRLLAVREADVAGLFADEPTEASAASPGQSPAADPRIVQPAGGAWPHAKGERWTDAELTAMRAMRNADMGDEEIARVAGCTRQLVGQKIGSKSANKAAAATNRQQAALHAVVKGK